MQRQAIARAQQNSFDQVDVIAPGLFHGDALAQVSLQQFGLADQVELETLFQHAGSGLIKRGKRHGGGIDQGGNIGHSECVQAFFDIIGTVVANDGVAGHLAAELPAGHGPVQVGRHRAGLHAGVDRDGVVTGGWLGMRRCAGTPCADQRGLVVFSWVFHFCSPFVYP